MPYAIIICDDNTLYASRKERIMQRSSMFDKLWFLTAPEYKGYDMSKCTVSLEYLLPVSKEYKNEILTLSEETYEEYLKYVLPFNSALTSEAGKIELQLTFVYADLLPDGTPVQRVRKTSTTTIDIIPISAWSDLIPDSALNALDQRIIKTDAQIKILLDAQNVLNEEKADNIKYDAVENSLQLVSGDKEIGDKVKLASGGVSGDGIPVVDLEEDAIVVEF